MFVDIGTNELCLKSLKLETIADFYLKGALNGRYSRKY